MNRTKKSVFGLGILFLTLILSTMVICSCSNPAGPTTYTITYQLNGGAWVSGYSAPTKFAVDKSVTLPLASKITKDTQVLTGWYTNSSFSGTALKGWGPGEQKSNITLYAKWEKGYITAASDAATTI